VGLELHQRGRRLPHAGVAVGRVGNEIGERRRKDAAAWNVGQVPGAGSRERSRYPVPKQSVEQRLERSAALRRRLAHGAAEIGGGDIAAAFLAAQRLDLRGAAPRHLVGHRAHALGRELEIYWSQSFTW